MNEAMMAKVAEDLVALSKRHGQEKLKIPRDPEQAMDFIRRFDYRKESELSIDDPQVINEAERLVGKYRAVLVLTNTNDLKYEFYVSSDQVASPVSPYSYSAASTAPSPSRGCAIGFFVIIGIVVLIVIVWVVAIMSGGGSTTQQRPSPPQGQTVGTMRAVSANQLNMRSGPGQTYSVVRSFSRNQRIVTIGDPQTVNGEQWIQASTPDGQTRGWVIRKFLSP